jgi:hypothetical protein
MTLTDLMLERETDASVKEDILFGQLDDAFATILRQIYLPSLSATRTKDYPGRLCGRTFGALSGKLKEVFGDAVDVSDEFKYDGYPSHTFTARRSTCTPTPSGSCWFSLIQRYRKRARA